MAQNMGYFIFLKMYKKFLNLHLTKIKIYDNIYL